MKKIILILLFLGMGGGICRAASADAFQEFISAGEAYKHGDYPKAIELYDHILREGFESGHLYYNLADSYYKKGEVGKAILNYERARRLIPRDSDLLFNLQYAASEAKMNIDQNSSANLLEKFWNNHAQFYSLDEMVIILTGIVFIFGLFHLASLFFKWPRRLRRLTLAVGVTFFVIYTAGLINKIQSEKNLAVVVLSTDAKFEPRPEATSYFKLSAGTQLKIIKSEGEWLKVQRFDGKLGWVVQKDVEKI